ncbi:hypothetical protein OAB96_02825 [Amylibacter sp.]|jgi:hypothetical protein|nr:hypothetical protein [Amylibacter sp.]
MIFKAYTLVLALAVPGVTLAGTVIIDTPEPPTVSTIVTLEATLATVTPIAAVGAVVTEALETLQSAEPGTPEAVEAVAIIATNIAVPSNLTPLQVQAAANILMALIATTPKSSPSRVALQRQLSQLQ